MSGLREERRGEGAPLPWLAWVPAGGGRTYSLLRPAPSEVRCLLRLPCGREAPRVLLAGLGVFSEA